jgi:Calpain family cysteine protease
LKVLPVCRCVAYLPLSHQQGSSPKRCTRHCSPNVAQTSMLAMQGCLRNQWLLGAIACVSSRPDLLLDLIVSNNLADFGLYTFQFYKHGCWHSVVVDDHLPCIPGQDEILFACSSDPGVKTMQLQALPQLASKGLGQTLAQTVSAA